MTRGFGNRSGFSLIMWLCLIALGPLCATAAWKYEKAPIRFVVSLEGKPTHAECGYYVRLPDGGILPKPFPQPVAVDAAGNVLKTYVLWQNSETGVDVVFESPKKSGDVTIYVGSSSQPAVWTPESGLKPSAILATAPGPGGKAAAQKLGRFGSTARTVHVRNRAGSKMAPLSVPGDLRGSGGPVSLYMLAHLVVSEPGSTWLSPLMFDGGTEMRINGATVTPEKKNNKPGGVGQAFEFSKGLQRIELFSWANNSASRNGIMTVVWRTPKTDMKSLGGKRPEDLPYPGTSMWEARPLKGNEIARSGHAKIKSVESKSGAPVARVHFQALENFWMGNERPLFVYNVIADTKGNPSDTRYEWDFGQGATVSKPQVQWLFSGGREHRVTLTASSSKGKTTVSVPLTPFTTKKTSLNNAGARENFRRAALEVLEAYPGSADPTANWSASHWNNLFRTVELNEGQSLLNHIFRVRWDTFRDKVPEDKQALLQEVFLDFLPRSSVDTAIKWTETFERDAKSERAKGMMKIRRAELYLYYQEDPDKARAILESILRQRKKDEVSEWARIRYGDIEFLSGDLNKATRMYGDVQNRAGHTIGKAPRPTGEPAAPAPLKGLAKTKAEMEAQDRERRERMKAAAAAAQQAAAPSGPSATEIGGQKIADWKVNALVEAASSEHVKSLVAQGFLIEAKRALQDWERNFPLSKISSDFVLNEAKFYMAMEDWQRAEAILDAYCDQIDASSFVPPAVEALLTCKIKKQEPREPMIEFCEKMRKKLEFHPAVKRIDEILNQLKR